MAAGSQITVVATAGGTVIVDPSGDAPGHGIEGKYVVRNKGAVSVYLGGVGVTTSGFELAVGEWVSFPLAAGDSLYGIAASSTCRVDVLRLEP